MTDIASSAPGRSASRLTRTIDALVLIIARHWLAWLNLVVFGFLFLAFAAPTLMALGVEGPARLLYLGFSFLCHQLPERSVFLFGPQRIYLTADLDALGLVPATLGLLERRVFIGNADIGYKVALCQRDLALYLSFALSGMVYRQVARRRPVRLPLWALLIFWGPLAADGLTQLVGLRESVWQLRFATGVLASFGTAWVIHPLIDIGMKDVVQMTPARPAATP